MRSYSSELRDVPKTLLVGSSGHASVVVDAIELNRALRVVGYLDDTLERGTVRRGYPVLGHLNEAELIRAEQLIEHVVVAIGDNWFRRNVYHGLIKKYSDFRFPVIKHPSAMVAKSAEVGRGTVLLAGSHIGPGSKVGEFCVLNTGSSIDHDCIIHDFVSIAPGTFTGGCVEIGECSAIGVGASISDRICIGRHVVVGTGAVVVRDIPDLVVAYGNPARVQRSRFEGEPYLRTTNRSSEPQPLEPH